MQKDPVCGMQVDEKKATATSTHKGQHYAFCGQACKDKFDQNPERYAHSKEGEQQQHSKEGQQQQHSKEGQPQKAREPQHTH